MEMRGLPQDVRPYPPEIIVKDPQSILLLAHHDFREGFVHCNLDSKQCCCTAPNLVNDMRAVQATIEATPAYQPNLPPFGQVVQRPPNFSGNSCHDCGGMMVRTGTCETCTECGTQGGCG